MNMNNLNRRDFLKLIGVSPLLFTNLPKIDINLEANSIESNKPNILILVFDALSARHMSLYGYARNTTPNIERFSQQASVYHRHYAGGNFTTPGTASLLTGAYPWSHRALQMRGFTLDAYRESNMFSLLADNYPGFAYTQNLRAYTLLINFRQHIAELLKLSDLAIYSDSLSQQWYNQDFIYANEAELSLLKHEFDPLSSPFLSILDQIKRRVQTGLTYEKYADNFPRGVTHCRAGKSSMHCFLLEDAINWLKQKVKIAPSPYLGYVHLLPPHAPYNPPRDFIGIYNDDWKPAPKPEHHFSQNNNQNKLNRHRLQYDEHIAYVDSEFGRLHDYLEKEGVLDNTILVFTSDHGELFERGIFGHVTPVLYEPVIHIPLIISRPGQQHREDFYSPTSTVDLLPTLLDIAGKSVPSSIEGQILPGFNITTQANNRNLYAVEAKENPKFAPLHHGTFALVNDQYKLIMYTGYKGYDEIYELYDLVEDPEEINNLYSPSNPTAKSLQEELIAKLQDVNP